MADSELGIGLLIGIVVGVLLGLLVAMLIRQQGGTTAILGPDGKPLYTIVERPSKA